ncbi:MAG: hypothetical protein M1831_001651 [Alyxoria varia]|nr:MAG: hypothetical protein M1831_001651 [Alyxoria varia]
MASPSHKNNNVFPYPPVDVDNRWGGDVFLWDDVDKGPVAVYDTHIDDMAQLEPNTPNRYILIRAAPEANSMTEFKRENSDLLDVLDYFTVDLYGSRGYRFLKLRPSLEELNEYTIPFRRNPARTIQYERVTPFQQQLATNLYQMVDQCNLRFPRAKDLYFFLTYMNNNWAESDHPEWETGTIWTSASLYAAVNRMWVYLDDATSGTYSRKLADLLRECRNLINFGFDELHIRVCYNCEEMRTPEHIMNKWRAINLRGPSGFKHANKGVPKVRFHRRWTPCMRCSGKVKDAVPHNAMPWMCAHYPGAAAVQLQQTAARDPYKSKLNEGAEIYPPVRCSWIKKPMEVVRNYDPKVPGSRDPADFLGTKNPTVDITYNWENGAFCGLIGEWWDDLMAGRQHDPEFGRPATGRPGEAPFAKRRADYTLRPRDAKKRAVTSYRRQ